jgi:hypothetical protein
MNELQVVQKTTELQAESEIEQAIQMGPAQKLISARNAATLIKEVIVECGLAQKFGAKEHVLIGGWDALAAMEGLFCSEVKWGQLEDGTYWVTTQVVDRHGNSSEATGLCGGKEATWKDRDAYAQRGMAATRSRSRALRQRIGYIIELAGYSATAAEEMTHEMFADRDALAAKAAVKKAKRKASKPAGSRAGVSDAERQQAQNFAAAFTPTDSPAPPSTAFQELRELISSGCHTSEDLDKAVGAIERSKAEMSPGEVNELRHLWSAKVAEVS